MGVTMSATITDKGVSLALSRLTGSSGGNGGGGTGRAMPGGALYGPKIAEIAARSMVYTWLPRVFDQNSYGWSPVLRGGKPLVRGQRTASSIRSAFVYSVAGAVASIRNVFRYAHVHDKGMTIKAKDAKFLRFKIGERWASKKSVKIPQRRFMYWPPAAKAFVLERVNFFIKDARKGKTA